ncbi:hypothetical protein GGD61_007966 [Bradyrhizobium sp. SBR1B]|nr:hypothetical protein [Bradyrhizobium sp. SBR1B]
MKLTIATGIVADVSLTAGHQPQRQLRAPCAAKLPAVRWKQINLDKLPAEQQSGQSLRASAIASLTAIVSLPARTKFLNRRL